ncbi:hypothetical protein Thena_1684 [Thermodesulfobium narugense DSM 14796]|uniref:Flagellar FliJ protein n=1 Tax=Thermodesulfobium narugense DSM 14796 TaxID=747365 RepID=M1E9H6_9BACT|nr:hypothetical protein [Thermodesulfobium narugense]AEE15294.1 hypothetical protein Thena_1684 [Thermodesulfobium narugense DSM 14796]
MKKFLFRFEKIKKLREIERDLSLNAFSRSLKKFMDKENEYKFVLKKVLNARNELNFALESGFSVYDINVLLNNLYILEELLRAKRDELYSAYLKAKEDKSDFLLKDMKKKIMEKIKEHHLRLYLKEYFKEDQTNIDEISSNISELKRKLK